MLPAVHECPDCGQFSQLSPPIPGTDMRCGRCDRILRRVRLDPLNTALACSLAALVFYALAVSAPFLNVMLYGRFRHGTLSMGPMTLGDEGMWALGAVVLFVTVMAPLVKILGTLYVLIRLRLPNPPPHLVPIFAALRYVTSWAMVDVYLLGFLVAYTRLQAIMYVQMGPGVYALAGLMLAMIATEAALDPEAVWEEMQKRGVIALRPKLAPKPGEHPIGCKNCHQVSFAMDGEDCPRCGETLYDRKPASMDRSWALMLTAVILYIPSNIFPIMTVVRFGKVQSYTIYAGIQELIHIGLWPLGLLVFTASMVIPIFKLLSLAYTLVQTHYRVNRELRARAHLYRVIDFIGRWSMVDVFMVSILVALVRFGQFAQVTANLGAVYFAAVVVLTMLAVESFDPRLMWDHAGESERI